MPELGSGLKPYSLPGVRYVAPKTGTFTPTEIVPDLRGAATLAGSAATMNMAAETIAKLPELLSKAEQAGRTRTQARAAHEYKMGKLGEGGKALEDFTFGADDTISYKPVDPLLRQLKYDEAITNAQYRRAQAAKAMRGSQPVYPIDVLGGLGGTDATELPAAATDLTSSPEIGAEIPSAAPASATDQDSALFYNPPPEPAVPKGAPTAEAAAAQPALAAAQTPQGQQALAQIGQEAAANGTLAALKPGSEEFTGPVQPLAQRIDPSPYVKVAEAAQLAQVTPPAVEEQGQGDIEELPPVPANAVAPTPAARPAAQVAPAPVRAPAALPPTVKPPSVFGDNGYFYASDGADARRVPKRMEPIVERTNGLTTGVLRPGDKKVTAVKDTSADLRKLEDETIMKQGHTAREVASMSEDQRKAIMEKAARKDSPAHLALKKAVIARGKNPEGMTEEEMSSILETSVPLKPAEKISAIHSIREGYYKQPSTVALFGSGQMQGIDDIKKTLDEMLAKNGNSFENIKNKQQQRTFVFQMNKLNDRNSAVLSGEYKAAADTLGLGDQIQLAWEKAQSGEQATPQQMKDIYDTVTLVHEAAKRDYMENIGDTIEAAKEVKTTPQRVGVPAKAIKWYEEMQKNATSGGVPETAATKPAAMAPDQRLTALTEILTTGMHEGRAITPEEAARIRAQIERLTPKTPAR